MAHRSNEYELIFGKQSLRLAWERYVRSSVRGSKDYIGINVFSSDLDQSLSCFSAEILSGEYSPTRPPKYFMPKASGMQRTMTVLSVEDALVYQAIGNHVASKVYDQLQKNHEFVFGSVLHEEVGQGLDLVNDPDAEFYFFKPWQILYRDYASSVNRSVQEAKVEFKFETDITGFYDSIPHYLLLEKIARMCNLNDDVLDLLNDCLCLWSGTRHGTTPGVGIPQGTLSSHFFANIFLHELDNLVSKEGLPYYRYMDDIRVYGYSTEQLQSLLVKIDVHLKQFALSLNSKKTSIERINPETIGDALINFRYDDDPLEIDEFCSHEIVELDETFSSCDKPAPAITIDDAENELLAFCRNDIREITQQIEVLATPKAREEIDLQDRAVQREFMNAGYKFRQAVDILRQHGKPPLLPQGQTLDGWLFLAEKYFWFINQFCWVLSLYQNNEIVKRRLLELSRRFEDYEWVQHEIFKCLALSQNFDARELRELFNEISVNESWFAKRAGYLLLLHNTDDRQFLRSIVSRAAEEPGELQRQILFMEQAWEKNGITRKELMEIFNSQ